MLFKRIPVSATCVRVTSLSTPNPSTEASVVNLRSPPELKVIFSLAASEAAVLKESLVALLEELKSPSEVAAIPAATNIASVPCASSGAENSILPKTSSAAISVSPVLRWRVIGLSSPVAVCFIVGPVSAS